MKTDKSIEDVMVECFQSPNVLDANLEPANVVDVIHFVNGSLRLIANAITPMEACASQDATGNRVRSLTEAVMGISSGAVLMADAINNLADAVRKSSDEQTS
jgi:hypothetical protein